MSADNLTSDISLQQSDIISGDKVENTGDDGDDDQETHTNNNNSSTGSTKTSNESGVTKVAGIKSI